MTGNSKYIGIHTCALAFALGIASAIGMFLFGLSAYYFAVGHPLIEQIGTIYLGFDASIKGSFIGAFWGFVEGFTGGLVIGWLYNFFNCRCCRKACVEKCTTKDETPKS